MRGEAAQQPQLSKEQLLAHACASRAAIPPGKGHRRNLLHSSLFPQRLFQPTLTHSALLPSTAWGRKQHLNLIKRLPSPSKRPRSNLCYLVSPSPVDGGGSSSSGVLAGLKGSRMFWKPMETGSLKMSPVGWR